jgi:hypothetical protein
MHFQRSCCCRICSRPLWRRRSRSRLSCRWFGSSCFFRFVRSALLCFLFPSHVLTEVELTFLWHAFLHSDEALYTPLLSFPDLYPATAARDATRIPLVDRLCRYLREPHPLATPQQTLTLNLDIVTFFRTLCDIHQEEAVIVLGSSWSLIPTLVICLERLSAIVWGVRPTIENVSLYAPFFSPLVTEGILC